MSIEQKIAELLAESKKLQQEEIVEETIDEEAVKPVKGEEEANVKKNNTDQTVEGAEDCDCEDAEDTKPVDQSKERLPEEVEHIYEDADDNDDDTEYPVKHKGKEIGAVYQMNGKWVAHHNASGVTMGLADKKTALSRLNVMHAKYHGVKGVKEQYDASEDVAALVNGEDLSEEFKAKAATIFEAAVVTRVKEEVSRLEEQFDLQLQEQVEEIKEGLIEKVDGYLNYVVEQWIEQNELALESGIKSEIVENFISGMKGLFEQHYIDIPEEKYDVLGDMEQTIEVLEAKLNEQVEASVALKSQLDSIKRDSLVTESASGLADTDVEKFKALAEELSYEDADSFGTKLQTIRENYFGKKATSGVQSVVTDEPVQITEEKVYSPLMAAALKQLDSVK